MAKKRLPIDYRLKGSVMRTASTAFVSEEVILSKGRKVAPYKR